MKEKILNQGNEWTSRERKIPNNRNLTSVTFSRLLRNNCEDFEDLFVIFFLWFFFSGSMSCNLQNPVILNCFAFLKNFSYPLSLIFASYMISFENVNMKKSKTTISVIGFIFLFALFFETKEFILNKSFWEKRSSMQIYGWMKEIPFFLLHKKRLKGKQKKNLVSWRLRHFMVLRIASIHPVPNTSQCTKH